MYTLVRHRHASTWFRRLLLLFLLLAVFNFAWRLGQAVRAARAHQPEPIGMVV